MPGRITTASDDRKSATTSIACGSPIVSNGVPAATTRLAAFDDAQYTSGSWRGQPDRSAGGTWIGGRQAGSRSLRVCLRCAQAGSGCRAIRDRRGLRRAGVLRGLGCHEPLAHQALAAFAIASRLRQRDLGLLPELRRFAHGGVGRTDARQLRLAFCSGQRRDVNDGDRVPSGHAVALVQDDAFYPARRGRCNNVPIVGPRRPARRA